MDNCELPAKFVISYSNGEEEATMTISQLRLNAECELYGKPHKVVTIDPPHVWLKRPDGKTMRLEYLTLITEPSFKPLKSMNASQ